MSFQQRQGAMKADDTYSLALLAPLINGYPFLPFTGSSLRPFCLAHIVNDIIINGRTNIIEFGSGISTIIIGRLIKRNNLNSKVVSVEHDSGWVALLKQILRNEGLDDVIEVIHSPLKENTISIEKNLWYDLSVLDHELKAKVFDQVIIDGPPAWEESRKAARYPAVPYIINKLDKNFAIYLDDANRQGEQMIIKRWKMEFGVEFNLTGDTLAYCYKGKSFYTEPFVYY